MAKRDSVEGLAAKLIAARENAGFSQAQAGIASGVSRTTINQFERGAKTPTLATLYKLAKAYGVDVRDLLPREVDTPPLPSEKAKPKKGKG